jgi:hypothetical protein
MSRENLMPELHPLDIATSLILTGDDTYRGQTTKTYANVIGPYGGITAACLMQAVLIDRRLAGTPVSLTVNLLAAVADGEFDITVKLARSGKYIQHWSVELVQNGRICSNASVITALREAGFDHQSVDAPAIGPHTDFDRSTGVFPLPWLNAYDIRFVEGAPAFASALRTSKLSTRSVQYVSDNPPRPLDYLSLTAISDSFLLRIFNVRAKSTPMGSVSITTHFTGAPEDIAAQGIEPVLGVVDGIRFHGNFHDQNMQIWGRGGKLLATGSQLVWFKN